MKHLQDINGNKSSKRLWGSIILGIGITLSVILFGFSMYKGAADSATALNIVNTFFLTGGGLLGIGVAEFFSKGGKK